MSAAVLLGFPLVLVVIALVVYLYTVVLFAPVLIVLERLPVFDAITRSFALVRNGFWRVLGIRVLTYIVATVVADAVAAPFSIVGQVMLAGTPSTGVMLLGTHVASIGSAIGQIITAPFNAGVIVLLYTDRRMRAEAFDLVLQTGAAGGPYATASTDNLWLTRPAVRDSADCAFHRHRPRCRPPGRARRARQTDLYQGFCGTTTQRLDQRAVVPADAEDRLDTGRLVHRHGAADPAGVAVASAVHVARRTMRTKRGGDYQLFEAGQLTAAQHRATAESYAAEGNWAAAIRHRLRAVARQLEETGVLNPAPGRTANELARRRRRGFAASGGRIVQSSNGFQRRHLRRATREPRPPTR